jgi:hypothetical protein
MAIWNILLPFGILWPFGIFYGHGIVVVIWYIFSVLVYCYKKNPATLPQCREGKRATKIRQKKIRCISRFGHPDDDDDGGDDDVDNDAAVAHACTVQRTAPCSRG